MNGWSVTLSSVEVGEKRDDGLLPLLEHVFLLEDGDFVDEQFDDTADHEEGVWSFGEHFDEVLERLAGEQD